MMDTKKKQVRLDKILSNSGYGSRTDVKKLIRSGAVACNGTIIKSPEEKFLTEITKIVVDGEELKYYHHVYLMMHKPDDVVCATFDSRHRTVIDLLPDPYRTRGLFPVGRLDIDTTGLLLLTDDGDLTHRLISPNKHIEKEYEAVLDKAPSAEVAHGFERGLILDDGTQLRPAQLLQSFTGDQYKFNVIITEGKFHQIKRMFLFYNINVVSLKRVRMGDLDLDPELEPGEVRELTESELACILL